MSMLRSDDTNGSLPTITVQKSELTSLESTGSFSGLETNNMLMSMVVPHLDSLHFSNTSMSSFGDTSVRESPLSFSAFPIKPPRNIPGTSKGASGVFGAQFSHSPSLLKSLTSPLKTNTASLRQPSTDFGSARINVTFDHFKSFYGASCVLDLSSKKNDSSVSLSPVPLSSPVRFTTKEVDNNGKEDDVKGGSSNSSLENTCNVGLWMGKIDSLVMKRFIVGFKEESLSHKCDFLLNPNELETVRAPSLSSPELFDSDELNPVKSVIQIPGCCSVDSMGLDLWIESLGFIGEQFSSTPDDLEAKSDNESGESAVLESKNELGDSKLKVEDSPSPMLLKYLRRMALELHIDAKDIVYAFDDIITLSVEHLTCGNGPPLLVDGVSSNSINDMQQVTDFVNTKWSFDGTRVTRFMDEVSSTLTALIP
eukprot:TRINITY_DN5654_c0_g3_i2.p1 TRINITY_DN5654_c0_g3~~TRINITY_DN5654_c0_g3_i2.p1  ORF type:complete len:449 (-),score=148.53 TRINITY_DN5654_c0_g3_i2:68-1339(-)